MFKIAIDKVISLILLILLFPFFSFLSLLILIILKKPIFFLHERLGKNEKKILVIKFKTLFNHSVSKNSIKKRENKFGNILRRYSIDELPQLINILKGDMSLVGPRPLEKKYLSKYNNIQKKRHKVLPGITGLAQINGRNRLSWKKKFQYDIFYIRKKSLCLDFWILLKTIVYIFNIRDVSDENHFNKEPFDGTN